MQRAAAAAARSAPSRTCLRAACLQGQRVLELTGGHAAGAQRVQRHKPHVQRRAGRVGGGSAHAARHEPAALPAAATAWLAGWLTCAALRRHSPLLQLLRDNAFNTFQPDLDLVTFRPLTNTGPLATYAGLWSPIAPFGPWDAAVPPGPPVPPGVLANAVAQDMQGPARTATRHAPGAVLPPA